MNRPSLIALLALSSFACAAKSAETRPDPAPGLLALNRTGVVTSRDPGSPSSAQPAYRVPEAVLRDPGERVLLMAQLRRQIVDKTRAVPEDRFQAVVRPQLATQLREAGFSREDAEQILTDVDRTRGTR